MNVVFLDSGFAIALELARDQHHAAARQCWSTFVGSGKSFVTTSFVLDEVATFLNARGYHTRAVRAGRRLMSEPRAAFLDIDRPLLHLGWDYFVGHADKRYSLTDCISFVVMEQRGIRQALTFDQHFAQAGFECLPAVPAGG